MCKTYHHHDQSSNVRSFCGQICSCDKNVRCTATTKFSICTSESPSQLSVYLMVILTLQVDGTYRRVGFSSQKRTHIHACAAYFWTSSRFSWFLACRAFASTCVSSVRFMRIRVPLFVRAELRRELFINRDTICAHARRARRARDLHQIRTSMTSAA
jgi:hypothetical protein